MPGLVLRLWVLALAVLFQASSWNSETCSTTAAAVSHVAGGMENGDYSDTDGHESGARDREAPEDGSEELSAVDDSSGNDVAPEDVPNWCNPRAADSGYAWVDGLAPGGPPADAPFKPPRA